MHARSAKLLCRVAVFVFFIKQNTKMLLLVFLCYQEVILHMQRLIRGEYSNLCFMIIVCVEELNSGPPNTNPSSGREEDLNPEPPDYKSSALTTRPCCLLLYASERSEIRKNCVHILSLWLWLCST